MRKKRKSQIIPPYFREKKAEEIACGDILFDLDGSPVLVTSNAFEPQYLTQVLTGLKRERPWVFRTIRCKTFLTVEPFWRK